MAKYIDREQVFEMLNSINGTSELDKGFEIIENVPTADVVSREVYDNEYNARKELEMELYKLHRKIDNAIEEITNISEMVHDGENHYYKDCKETKREILEILDKLIESEG